MSGLQAVPAECLTLTRKEINSCSICSTIVREVLPEIVKDGEYKSVKYGALIPLLISAVQDLSTQVSQLRNELQK